MRKGIFLGQVTTDIVYYVSHYPANNQKLKAERQLAFAGGPAANAAVTFAAFGDQAHPGLWARPPSPGPGGPERSPRPSGFGD